MAELDSKERIAQLEEEGEIAADYLEELLDIADLDGDIEIDVHNGRAYVEVVAEPSSSVERLVGDNGEVLDALQDLTRLTVQTATGDRSRMMLDIGGFRMERRHELEAITDEAIARLRATGEPQHLEAMNPFERKICHDVVASAGLVSESEGSTPDRHVVILDRPLEDESGASGEVVCDENASEEGGFASSESSN